MCSPTIWACLKTPFRLTARDGLRLSLDQVSDYFACQQLIADHIKGRIAMHYLFFVAALFALTATSSVALAQVPPDIAEGIRKIGPIVDGPGNQKLYAPLFANQKEPYPDVTVVRDIAYGTDPLQKLDLFTAAPTLGAPKPVVLFIHGGGFERGDKRQPGSPF